MTTAVEVSLADQIAHIEYCASLCTAPEDSAQLAVETAVLRSLQRLSELEADARRFKWCQDNPHQAQAMFWNFQSRRDRAKAIDRAMESV